jgi:hypothetical protein
MKKVSELDEVVRLTTRRTWAMLLALVVVLGSVIGWGYLARISSTLTLDGILLAGVGPTLVTAPAAGTVRLSLAHSGQEVSTGDKLYVLDTAGGPVTVVSPTRGVLVGGQVSVGAPVVGGARLAVIDDVSGALTAVLPFDARRGALPAGTTARAGRLTGAVTKVEPYPMTADELAARYGLTALPGTSDGRELIRPVLVRLDAAAWPGATYTPIRLVLTVGSERPADLLSRGGR